MAGRRFRSHRPGVRFDFGAIGKGFVLDRLGETLRSLGIERFFLNASGNMLCGAPPQLPSDTSEARGWPVSIATLGQPDRELQRRRLVQRGIATSGDQYQRFPDSSDPGGIAPTSHIVDPLRRRGLDMPCMATVLGPRAADADALATACCVLLQRGTLASWLDRHEEELQGLGMEMVLQSARGEGIRLTSVACDW
jgi:thiamine biosynthesis lipoprotein